MGGAQALGLAALLSSSALPVRVTAFCSLVCPPFLDPSFKIEYFKGHVAAGGRDSYRVVDIRSSSDLVDKTCLTNRVVNGGPVRHATEKRHEQLVSVYALLIMPIRLSSCDFGLAYVGCVLHDDWIVWKHSKANVAFPSILCPRENPKIGWRVDPYMSGVPGMRSFRVLTWTEYKLISKSNLFGRKIAFHWGASIDLNVDSKSWNIPYVDHLDNEHDAAALIGPNDGAAQHEFCLDPGAQGCGERLSSYVGLLHCGSSSDLCMDKRLSEGHQLVFSGTPELAGNLPERESEDGDKGSCHRRNSPVMSIKCFSYLPKKDKKYIVSGAIFVSSILILAAAGLVTACMLRRRNRNGRQA